MGTVAMVASLLLGVGVFVVVLAVFFHMGYLIGRYDERHGTRLVRWTEWRR